MEATTSRERQRARAIAEEYRSRGYEVIEQPSPEQLPEFLAGYHPDVLVRKGDEAIIVEVKSRSSLTKDPRDQGAGAASPGRASLELRIGRGGGRGAVECSGRGTSL